MWPRRWMPRCSRPWPRHPIGARPRDTTACSASAWNGSGRGSGRGTRCSRARPAPIQAAARRSPKPQASFHTSARWASTSSTCRRSIRSAAASARGATTPCRPGPDDVGSPWAIGSEAGGHTAIEPGLGTLDDFDRFVAAAKRHGLEIALDIAFQASPDHPWVREHPEWFRHRPDGTIKYAENPPKKYQDIYPINFESEEWQALWNELKNVIDILDRPRRDDLPRRQSAHQAVPLLGMGAGRDQARSIPRRSSCPRRSPGRR